MPKWIPRRGNSATSQPRTRNSRIFWSYLPDWVLTIFLWGIFYLIDKINGYRRLFSVTDESLAHPYAEHERIPVWLLAVICGIAPALVIVLCGGLLRSFWDVHTGLLGLVLSLGLGVTFTDIVKITVGRPRPDLFSRCQLPPTLTSNPVHGLTSWTACTQHDLLQEGFRSFPSGHSSFAWTGMWYLELYLMAKLRVANQRGYAFKSWLLLVPVSCSTLVSISRTMDYRHHATDVIAGAIIGLIVAWWGYRQYYPPLSAPRSWKPYSPRIPRDDNLPLHSNSGGSGTSGDDHALLNRPSMGTNMSPASPVDGSYAYPNADPSQFSDRPEDRGFNAQPDGYPPRQFEGNGYAGQNMAMQNAPFNARPGNPAFPTPVHASTTAHNSNPAI